MLLKHQSPGPFQGHTGMLLSVGWVLLTQTIASLVLNTILLMLLNVACHKDLCWQACPCLPFTHLVTSCWTFLKPPAYLGSPGPHCFSSFPSLFSVKLPSTQYKKSWLWRKLNLNPITHHTRLNKWLGN
jgi:hypothetical protein